LLEWMARCISEADESRKMWQFDRHRARNNPTE